MPGDDELSPELLTEAATFQDAARHYEEEFGAASNAVAITLGVRKINALMLTAVGRFLDSLELDVNLSGARLTVLREIYFEEDHRLGLNELWRRMQVSRTNITNLVDGLERDGLVERAINPADRRSIDTHLTEKGQRLCADVLPQMAVFMEGLCRNFTAEELRSFSDYLARFQGELLLRATMPVRE